MKEAEADIAKAKELEK